MLSFEKGKNGFKIARIQGGKYDKNVIYMNTNETKNGFNETKINDGVLIPLPNKNIVEKIYISAVSGAGKSTWAGKYMMEYKKMFKNDEVLLYSTIDYDKELDKSDPMRVKIDEALVNDPLSLEELSNNLVVFDDVDTISKPFLLNYVRTLIDYLLEVGRHYNIRLIITSHLLSNYKHTRRVLNEATCVVIFPRAGNLYHIKQYLKNYAGFEQKNIVRILKLRSRWIAIYRNGFNPYVMYEHGVYILEPDI